MDTQKIIIIGGGGHAKVVASILKKHPSWNPVGYLDTDDKGYLLGLPYLGVDETLPKLMKEQKISNAAVGIGQIKNVAKRKETIQKIIKNAEIYFPPIISPDALISNYASIGEGTVIVDGVVVQPETSIGKYSIVNTGATIDHDCQIGDYVHIAPGANLSGGVSIEDYVLVGVGACLIQNIHVVKNTIIAAGAVVHKSITETGLYAGVPAAKKE